MVERRPDEGYSQCNPNIMRDERLLSRRYHTITDVRIERMQEEVMSKGETKTDVPRCSSSPNKSQLQGR